MIKSQKTCENSNVINVSHKLQVSWAAAVERIVSRRGDTRDDFVQTLEEVAAIDDEGAELSEKAEKDLRNNK